MIGVVGPHFIQAVQQPPDAHHLGLGLQAGCLIARTGALTVEHCLHPVAGKCANLGGVEVSQGHAKAQLGQCARLDNFRLAGCPTPDVQAGVGSAQLKIKKQSGLAAAGLTQKYSHGGVFMSVQHGLH